MINGNSIVSRPSKEQARGERKTIDMEQIVGQPGSGVGGGGASSEEDGGLPRAGSRSGKGEGEGRGGVIDFGKSVSQYATFAVQDEEDEAKEAFVKRGRENEKFVKQIGLENGYNDNIWQSNINSNSENNGQTRSKSNSNNNNNIDNHQNSYTSFSARRKRFQDSDRLQISDISSDENSENSRTSFVDESDSSDLSEKATTTATTLTSTSTSDTLFSSASIKIDTSKLKCRVERNFYLDFETYKHYSCAICYT